MLSRSRNTLITGGTFVDSHSEYHGQHIHKQKTGFDILTKNSSPSAFYNNAGDRFDAPKCHPNTRTAVLDKVMDWVIAQKSSVGGLAESSLWLYGPAGAGKSAIAQTIAERCHSKNLLLAAFFFSRTDARRNQGDSLIATLAYQVALHLPATRDKIEEAIDLDPLIFTRSPTDQFRALIIDPILHLADSGLLESEPFPPLIIIDGLDECQDQAMQCLILDAISASMREYDLPLLFLVASRPEAHLYIEFADPKLYPNTVRLPLDDKYHPTADIIRYLEDSLRKIKKTHPLKNFIPPDWPTSHDIDILAMKSSGQFIYAATVVKYVSSPRHQPTHCLEIVLGLRPPNSLHAPFGQLDALYSNILFHVEERENTLKILGFLLFPSVDIVAENLLKIPRFLEKFLDMDPGDVQRLLLDLVSLISYQDQDTEIRVHHASFGDYLLDESRSKEYFIDPIDFHDQLSIMYCQFIQRSHREHDYSDDDDLTLLRYSYRHLVENLLKSPPSIDVMEELLETPIVPPLFYLGTYQDLQYFLDFFSCLEPLSSENPQIRDYHLKIWDEYLLSELQNFPSLLFIYVCSVLLDADFSGSIYSTVCCLLPDHWDSEFSHVKWLYTWERSNRSFGTIDRPSPAYRTMLLDFFLDEERSGRYTLNGVAYAAVACLMIKYTSPDGAQKTRIEDPDSPDDDDDDEPVKPFLGSPTSTTPADESENEHEPIITAVLAFLPLMLSKSDYSSALIQVIESHCFRDECSNLSPLIIQPAKTAMLDYKSRWRREHDEWLKKARLGRKKHARSI